MTVYNYLESKTSKEVADKVYAQYDLDLNDSQQWYDATTNCVLSNYDYFVDVINLAVEDWEENKKDYLEDGMTEDEIVKSFVESEEDFVPAA